MPDLAHTAIADIRQFEERIKHVPLAPGIYLWKDRSGTIIYVGKSKALRDRMRSYLGAPRNLTPKTRRLVAQIADFEIIVTGSELEALLLEMNFIKEHRPRFNIRLADDKSYQYIKITLRDPWPRVMTTRKVLEDGARYFGPYSSAGALYRTLDQLNKLFAFRPPSSRCNDDRFNRHRRLGKPCMYYDIKRCLGPCVPGLVEREEYRATIERAVRFLEGKTDEVMRDLKRRMETAAEDLNFERAAYLRDRMNDITKISERQQVLRTVDTDQDVLALAREEGSAVVQVFYIRGGKLIGAEPFALQNAEDETDANVLAQFITQFYENAAQVPPNLLLAEHIEEPRIIEQWLAGKSGHKVEIKVPRRGENHRLVEMATDNARRKLEELRLQWLNSEQRAVAGLSELRDLLGLDGMPGRIECFDISNTQGTNSVGAMVVFERGEPKKARYRKFKIKGVIGANDPASMAEIVRRRFQRAAEALGEADNVSTTEDPDAEGQAKETKEVDSAWAELPDLLLIDGGVAQLNAARTVLADLKFEHIPIVGVVKGVDRNRFDLLRPNTRDLIVLGRDSAALRLVQQIDEEADRFAKDYHRTLRTKGAISSTLEEIPGIGPRRRQALLKAFGSLDGIRAATIDQLAAVPGMTRKSAEELKGIL